MRLHEHEKIVEAMARALHKASWQDASEEMWARYPSEHLMYLESATAALDALLDAAVRLKVSRDTTAYAFAGDEAWGAGPPELVVEDCFPALILRLEARDDE
jgi:hypothetical protein